MAALTSKPTALTSLARSLPTLHKNQLSEYAARAGRLGRRPRALGALGPRLSVTAGRAFEIRYSLTWLDQDRVELIAVTALPFNLHGQLRDGLGGLCQSLHTLCPKLRFAHGRLSRLRFQT